MTRGTLTVIVIALTALSSCGGGDDDADSDAESVGAAEGSTEAGDDEFADVLGAGSGGGMLILDGAEVPLSAATCLLDDDTFDSGAVSGDGIRVFATKSNPLNDVSAQILDADLTQWFPQDVQGDEASRDGDTITSPSHTYFNNQDDRTIDASFTIECP